MPLSHAYQTTTDHERNTTMSTNIRTTAGRAKLKPRHDPYWHKLDKARGLA